MKLSVVFLNLCLIFVMLSLNTQLSAQERNEDNFSSFSLTVNPAYYVLGGYSVKGLYHLPQRWSFGLTAEASFELPDFARDQFFENQEDIVVDWDFLIGLEARYRFKEGALDQGFYALGAFGYEGWTVQPTEGQGEDEFENFFSSLGIGYNWYPFHKKHFHLGASYNLIFILNNTDERLLDGRVYNIRPVVPPSILPSTISLGWRF